MCQTQFVRVYINIKSCHAKLLQGLTMFLIKKGEKKHTYSPQSIAQKMLAYITQHLCKSEQKKVQCYVLTKIYTV